MQISFNPNAIPQPQADYLLKLTQHALDDLNDFPTHHLRLSPPTNTSALELQLQLVPDTLSAPTAILLPNTRALAITLNAAMLPTDSSTSSSLAAFIADQLHHIFLPEQAAVAHALGTSKSLSTLQPYTPQLDQLKTRAFKWSPAYHLTFSLITPTHAPSEWDIAPAIASTIQPLLHGLRHVSNFTLDTQVQCYATFSPSVHPTYSAAHAAWFLSDADLGSFINAAEWPLSPSISAGPTVNFLVYVPAPEHTPLYINASASPILDALPPHPPHSWLIPQWGAVYIHNPAPDTPRPVASLTPADLEPALLQFSSHLLALLGLPAAPSASILLRLDGLTRILSLTLLRSASSTLGALARLTVSLPSISIPPSVAASVDATLERLDAACQSLTRGDFRAALEAGKTAEVEAEQAFFERSMVGQVYFPEEHKVAVYLPLLGPVAVPLVLALLRELRSLVLAARARRAAAAS